MRVSLRAPGRARRSLEMLAVGFALLGLIVLPVRVAHAQAPPRPRPDTNPSPPPLTPSDSALRDSVITSILAEDSARVTRAPAFAMFGLDRLRLRTVGASYGIAWPGQATQARLYSVHADYGQVYPDVRLLAVSSYWSTGYRDGEVARLANEVQRSVPNATEPAALGRIRVADLSAGAELRWQPSLARRATRVLHAVYPWVGGGFALHFVNVEGRPISDTFVERALDAATIGLNTSLGIDIRPVPNFAITTVARYDFLSSVRYGSVRAGATFVFGPAGGW